MKDKSAGCPLVCGAAAGHREGDAYARCCAEGARGPQGHPRPQERRARGAHHATRGGARPFFIAALRTQTYLAYIARTQAVLERPREARACPTARRGQAPREPADSRAVAARVRGDVRGATRQRPPGRGTPRGGGRHRAPGTPLTLHPYPMSGSGADPFRVDGGAHEDEPGRDERAARGVLEAQARDR